MATFGDIRQRGQISAAALQAAGEAIDAAQFAWQSQGDNPPLVSNLGSIPQTDVADLFFAKITAVVTVHKYGFIEQVLKPDGTYIDASEPRQCTGVLNWAYPPAGITFSVGDKVVMRRSSYNPDLFEIVAITGGGTISVCGVPETDLGCGTCDLTTHDERVITNVRAIIAEPCDFIVEEIDDGTCGGSGSGSGSGAGTDLGKAAWIRLGGKTEEVAVLLGAKFCPDTCEVVTWTRTLCFRNGLYIGHIDETEPACP